jgi:hypothetical protein
VSHTSPIPDSFYLPRPTSRSRRAECVTYRCRGRGALLSLPNGGLRQDVIHRKVFQKYVGDNVVTWFDWSKNKGLPVESMEDLVFVYGCTLVTSWAAAAFDDHTGNAQLSLASRTLDNGGAGFTWSNIRGTVEYHDSQLNPVCSLPDTLTCSTLTSFPLSSQKEYSIPSSKSMRFHQVPPSKTRSLLENDTLGWRARRAAYRLRRRFLWRSFS